MINYKKNILLVSILIFIGCMFTAAVHTVGAEESVDDLREQIEEGQRQLEKIEKEIKKYEAELNKVGAEKETLQSAIRELDLSRDKVKASIRATEKKISSTDLEIEELEREIYIKELEIGKNKEAIAQSFRNVDQLENNTIIEILLRYDSMVEVWDELEEQALLQESLRESTKILNALQTEYKKAKNKSLEKKGELVELTNELSGEEQTLAHTIYQKDELLDQTENKEANYQKLLVEKRKKLVQFRSDLSVLENQLRIILDPNAFPEKGTKVFSWPVDDPYITQDFGLTPFAQSGVYGYDENGNPKPHRAIDLRAQIGDPIYSALSGTVKGAYNMDSIPGCKSYGQWILVEHDNGLSTLYTHLSSMLVQKGEKVETGKLIGYSGISGLSTGPHLHFGVYATQGVQIQKFTSSNGCKEALIPLASPDAYLNPLDYL